MNNLAQELRKIADLIDGTQERMLTKEEYAYIKSIPLEMTEFWEQHLTPQGYMDYKRSSSQGKHGKWLVYQNLYNKYKSPLARIL